VAVEIVFPSLEKLMFPDSKNDVEIAWRPASPTRFTFTADTEFVADIDTSRNLYLEGSLPEDPPITTARLAGVLDDLTGSPTLRTASRDAEESLLEANLPVAVAR
jgi:hypothetical protein